MKRNDKFATFSIIYLLKTKKTVVFQFNALSEPVIPPTCSISSYIQGESPCTKYHNTYTILPARDADGFSVQRCERCYSFGTYKQASSLHRKSREQYMIHDTKKSHVKKIQSLVALCKHFLAVAGFKFIPGNHEHFT